MFPLKFKNVPPVKKVQSQNTDDLFKHDILSSLHALKLSLSQMKSSRESTDLLDAMVNEVISLEESVQSQFYVEKKFTPLQLALYIKRFFINAYPENRWKQLFEFKFHFLNSSEIKVVNLKQVLRNLAHNLRENQNTHILIEFSCRKHFKLKISSMYSDENCSTASGLGLQSIHQNLSDIGGRFELSKKMNKLVQELIFPIFVD
mgnify:CR=1 FL=1|jgi:hypothetical protein